MTKPREMRQAAQQGLLLDVLGCRAVWPAVWRNSALEPFTQGREDREFKCLAPFVFYVPIHWSLPPVELKPPPHFWLIPSNFSNSHSGSWSPYSATGVSSEWQSGRRRDTSTQLSKWNWSCMLEAVGGKGKLRGRNLRRYILWNESFPPKFMCWSPNSLVPSEWEMGPLNTWVS